LKVNSVSPELRTLDSIKKKWKKLKSTAKQSGANATRKKRKTGGGTTDEEDVSPDSDKILCMDTMTKKIISKIGPTAYKGIEGGIDSSGLDRPVAGEDYALVLVGNEVRYS